MTDDAQPAPSTSAPDLGAGFEVMPAAPGRYALEVARILTGTHALQALAEHSRATLVLELGVDGAATARRGWRYDFDNRGPLIQTHDRYRERMGYRGRYSARGEVITVQLQRDDSVCPHRFEGALALARASTITLRCVRALPTAGARLPAEPVLVCRSDDPLPDELGPLLVPELAPRQRFVLGAGAGLRLRLTGSAPGARVGPAAAAQVLPADTPVDVQPDGP